MEFMLLYVLGIQIITGIGLAMHYVPNTEHAFMSVEHIMHDVNFGWLLRYIHANGASMFFIVIYMHIFRGVYYASFVYPNQFLWVTGIIGFALMIVTAFMGYVLPWGQMSFWGATVITNLFSAIPVFGPDIVLWLWGGYSVDNPTLSRFYSLHYLIPFILIAMAGVHLFLLHEVGSTNPLGLNDAVDGGISFYPYYISKDLFGIFIFLILFGVFLFFSPNALGHPDNYTPANPLITPPHIVPEWYFLPFYAILRSVPDKLQGVIYMADAILILAVLPFFCHPFVRSTYFRPFSRLCAWFFFADMLLLGWLGSKPVDYPYLDLAWYCTHFYFFNFVILWPLALHVEKYFWSQRYTEYRNEQREKRLLKRSGGRTA